ncbi:MAG: FKBP-type peptidyl-prolyl cis-trans isomerase [Anaerolineales bacterium]|nr:FKBP-type peptidyl-prolyl cis-trans isomerase [Anaerolineales bacterium]
MGIKTIREKRRAARAARARKIRLITGAVILLVASVVVLLIFSSRNAVPTAQTTPPNGGWQIEDLVIGDGPAATNGNLVSVHYTGWLLDGTKFDSSLDRGQPFEFTIGEGQVIRGWEEGLVGMRAGGKRQLTIPPDMAYGAAGRGSIPPNATLIFEIELLEIKGGDFEIE